MKQTIERKKLEADILKLVSKLNQNQAKLAKEMLLDLLHTSDNVPVPKRYV